MYPAVVRAIAIFFECKIAAAHALEKPPIALVAKFGEITHSVWRATHGTAKARAHTGGHRLPHTIATFERATTGRWVVCITVDLHTCRKTCRKMLGIECPFAFVYPFAALYLLGAGGGVRRLVCPAAHSNGRSLRRALWVSPESRHGCCGLDGLGARFPLPIGLPPWSPDTPRGRALLRPIWHGDEGKAVISVVGHRVRRWVFIEVDNAAKDGRVLWCTAARYTHVNNHIFVTASTPIWFLVVALVLVGLGAGLFSAPNTALIMSTVPMNKLGIQTGFQTPHRITEVDWHLP